MNYRNVFSVLVGVAGFALLVGVSALVPAEDLTGPMSAVAGILVGAEATAWLVFALLAVVACAAAVWAFTYKGHTISLEYALGISVLFLCGPVPAAWLLVLALAVRVAAYKDWASWQANRRNLLELGARPLMALGAGLVFHFAGGVTPLRGLELVPGLGDRTVAGWAPVALAVCAYLVIRDITSLPLFKWEDEKNNVKLWFSGRAPEWFLNGGVGIVLAHSFGHPGVLPAIFRAGLILFACRVVRQMAENREVLRRRVEEMRSLNMVGRAICSSMQPEDLMTVVYRECRRLLDPSLFYVALHDDEKKVLRMELVAEGDDVLQGVEVPVSSGFSGLVFRTRKPTVFQRRKDLEAHPHYMPGREIGTVKCESFLWVPIATKDRVYGVLSAQHVDAYKYSPQTAQAVQAIANQAAVALENIQLFRKATTDTMTGLYLRSYFEQKLEEQMFKARRHGYRLSLMIIDLDNFKEINDTMGHAAGDEVLREVGQAIGHSIRVQDVAARYGGDEFLLLLPGISIENCLDVAARIKATVQALNFPVLARMGTSRITVSIGIATVAPGEQTDLKSLFETADQALYEAKRSGKNKVLARSQAS